MKITLDINGRVLIRWALAVLLIWAALSKLANLQDFYGNLLSYRLPLADFILRAIAIALPWMELICGLMLLAQVRSDAALGCAALLFGVFVIATGQAWLRGLNISCGCFNLRFLGLSEAGSLSHFLQSAGFAFFRALALAVGSIYLFRSSASGPVTQRINAGN